MTKQLKEKLKTIPYYTKIPTLRYDGVKGKAWRITSEFTRYRDFILYSGECISCWRKASSWSEFDAGHYLTMGGHGAASGFFLGNINAQCFRCNSMFDGIVGEEYKRKATERNPMFMPQVMGMKVMSVKADEWYFLERIEYVYREFKKLKENHHLFDYPKYMLAEYEDKIKEI